MNVSLNPTEKKENIKSILLFSVFLFLTAYFIFKDNGYRYNSTISILSFLISSISLFKIFKSYKYPFSLNIIFHLWILFFCAIAPVIQYKSKSTFWGAKMLSSEDYILGNVIVLLILFLYNYSYQLSSKYFVLKENKFKSQVFLKQEISRNSRVNILVLVSLSLLGLIVFSYSVNFNFRVMLFRGGIHEFNENLNISNLSLKLIIGNFIRPIPVICLLIYKIFNQKKSNHYFVEVFLILLVLLSNFPSGIPRFQSATLYIPILMVYFNYFRKSLNFALIFCIGLLIVFPFLNQFRYLDGRSVKMDLDTEMFEQPHFDSYQHTINVIKYDEITYGRQLVGVIFFFVPRSFWMEKPVGSGAYLAEKHDYFFSNISMSFFGEGYINFGFFGLVFFTLLLGFLNAKIDVKYWCSHRKSNYLKLFYLLLLGMQFFILRGDLLSSFAYTLALFLSSFVTIKLAVKRLNKFT